MSPVPGSVREPVRAYLALGANLGDPLAALRRAMDAIDALPQTRVTRRSALYRSAPLDADGPDYVNAVVEVMTTLPLPALLDVLQKLEHAAGRTRSYLNAPRPLDLDILLYGSARMDSPRLTVPHPRMGQRAFVLRPLAELAPERVDAQALAAVAGQAIERLG